MERAEGQFSSVEVLSVISENTSPAAKMDEEPRHLD